MTRVKICGCKRLRDIEIINEAVPDYCGFVFAESKRKVTIEQAAALCSKLSPEVAAVGVFVNHPVENIVEIASACKLKAVQLHGEEDSRYIAMLKQQLEPGTEVWKAVRVKDEESLKNLDIKYGTDAYLLDAFSKSAYGGTGETFDWKLLLNKDLKDKVFIAGGLDTENITELLQHMRPYGVDVSSGVETDGFKDEVKIKNFISKVRE